jgi:hypothetical protein
MMKPKNHQPVRLAQYEYRMQQLKRNVKAGSVMMDVAPIAVSQLRLVLEAYYGGPRRMVVALLKQALWVWWDGLVSRALLWISDGMGWTKVYEVPETKDYVAHQRRHGRQCSGSPNCRNLNCVLDGMPGWYRKIMESRYE